ncbi:MAG: ABC transporter substrate-binding protein [Candidatus Rokubacteria bacterium]|nr:ABC transporter substrate-binding protein [Candidatus Rokubacteria bacterium]
MARRTWALVGVLSGLALVATATAQTPAPAGGRTPQPGRVYKVGYSQIVDHPALNETRRGFLDGLKQAGFVEGQNLVFQYQNAQGDVGNARNIAEKFLADGVDVITPCTTPNVQAAVKVARGGRTPVVFGCVTDPVSAGILESVGRPSGTNVTGVYNPLPIGELFDLFLKIQPGMRTAGTIYNASEANSQVINRQAKAEAERRGIKWVEVTVAGTADVKTASESLVGKVDALVLGQDNTVASAFEAVVKVAADHHQPIFSMDTQAPARGAIASLAASNYEQGVLWAKEMVAPVLLGTDPATVTPIRPRVFDLTVNLQAAAAARLTIPKEVVDRATKVLGR